METLKLAVEFAPKLGPYIAICIAAVYFSAHARKRNERDKDIMDGYQSLLNDTREEVELLKNKTKEQADTNAQLKDQMKSLNDLILSLKKELQHHKKLAQTIEIDLKDMHQDVFSSMDKLSIQTDGMATALLKLSSEMKNRGIDRGFYRAKRRGRTYVPEVLAKKTES